MGNPVKILVLGKGGMLGSRVFDVLSKFNVFEVTGTDRSTFNPLTNTPKEIFTLVSKYDYVINCIGVIKPAINLSCIDNAIYINSVFPHLLARCCKEGVRLIHISTDCVYSGIPNSNPNILNCYTEDVPHDATDLYGKSKSLGEPPNCMTLRTSIIGEEPQNSRSLVSWFLKQRGECDGFENHFWNGITTNEYAKVCKKIILNDWYKCGLYHIFSTSLNKSLLLTLLKQKYKKDIRINTVRAAIPIDRTLGTTKDLCSKLQIPPINEMVEEM